MTVLDFVIGAVREKAGIPDFAKAEEEAREMCKKLGISMHQHWNPQVGEKKAPEFQKLLLAARDRLLGTAIAA